MVSERVYAHDVAFSFMKQDEALALSLRTALAPLSSFVYSKMQEQLAGTDGMESFRAAFRTDSRLNVILLRSGWGSTRWTRVEENAIKDRCFEDGFDSLLVVKVDKSPNLKWCPDRRIYFDIEAFPFEQAVGAIKRQATQLGSVIRPPSAADLARAQVEQENFDADTAIQLRMGTAFLPAYADLGTELMAKAKEVGEASGRGIVTGPGQMGSFVVFDTNVSLQVMRPMYLPTSLEEAVLTVALVQGRVSTEAELLRGTWNIFGTRPIEDWPIRLRRVAGTGWCWEMRGKTLPAAETADALLSALLEARQRTSRGPLI